MSDGPRGAGAAPHAVLLVDDDDFVRSLLARQLAGLGTAVVTQAGGGASALAMLHERGPFHLVICDLQMPGMDGVEFLRHLALAQPGVAVVLISTQERKVRQLVDELVRARGLHLLGSLAKPVATSDLRELLAALDQAPRTAGAQPLPDVSADELREALAAGEIDVHVQPKVEVRTRRLVGVEALARWIRPDGRCIFPERFIPVAEATGLIDPLTDTVVRKAFESCGEWARGGLVTGIAVNASTATLQRLDLPELMTDMAVACSVEPRQVIVEITESGVLQEGALSLDVLTRLRLRGFTLSIDDFGLGYSSLQQVQRLPFSELKIDRSFVAGLLTNPESARIVESTLLLARNLGLKVTAEGVETEPQLLRLAELGCDYAQGYFIARPFPRAELPAWAREHSAT